MSLEIVRNDITEMKVDSIVNAANSSLKMGGGVCGAIFQAAGERDLQAECDKIGSCNVGEAVITGGYDLPAKQIIHAVGPIWQGGKHNEAKLLHDCYRNALNLAEKHELESIAFPLISSGIYGYPKDQAIQIAIQAISEFLMGHEMKVYLVVYDQKSFVISSKLFSDIEKYIDDHYVEEHTRRDSNRRINPYEYLQTQESVSFPLHTMKKRSLEDVLGHLDESFSEMLLRLIDEKGMTDVETYKRANIDRKLFSKIRSTKSYNPSKATAIAFTIALKLNLDETKDLLSKAGYTLSQSNKFDVIIQYFIEEGNYDIHEMNEVLFAFEQVLLGC